MIRCAGSSPSDMNWGGGNISAGGKSSASVARSSATNPYSNVTGVFTPSVPVWGGTGTTAQGLGCNHHTYPSGATGAASANWNGPDANDPGVTLSYFQPVWVYNGPATAPLTKYFTPTSYTTNY
jgi:hypothetical protein